MKLTIAILATSMIGTAWAQSPSIIDNTKAKLNGVQQQQTAASNAALAATQGQTSAPQTSPNSAKAPAAKPVTSNPAPAAKPAVSAAKKPTVTVVPVASSKKTVAKAAKAPVKSAVASKPAEAKSDVAVEDKKTAADKKDEPKTINMAGRRDPFISPVVNHLTGGSGCNTGKRCLAVDQIALTGVVKADTGMIAVVVNAMNKAYFLRENDPVFNGYVVKITGDSIIFKETIQDKLGKPFTREVTKKISTPAV